MNEDERCEEARRFQQIDEAFRRGDLEALRAAVPDPAAIPNGPMPDVIGSCLVYAIYHSPRPFIRTLLELGADPNAPADDGFPPLVAALVTGRDQPGTTPRPDVEDVVRLLLSFGADPNQRGINDYTALHTAVAERRPVSVLLLLEAGADPDARTRIDECETAGDLARRMGAADLVQLIATRGRPPRRRLRSGLTLLLDLAGTGALVRRQHNYRARLRFWLHQGEPVRWTAASGPVGAAWLEDGGTTLMTEVRIDRRSLVNGVFYGVDGMRVGGMRRVEIAPHLAYGERGVPGIIPPNALLTAEITILAEA
jgi:hypothetical protein